jgi:small subunit ribosomal protein S16
MLKIRLQRTGRKHEPSFRVALIDSRKSTKSGRFIELLGNYHAKMGTRALNAEKIKYWLGMGAKPSTTMHNMLIDAKIIEGAKINVLPTKKPEKNAEAAKTEPATITPPAGEAK